MDIMGHSISADSMRAAFLAVEYKDALNEKDIFIQSLGSFDNDMIGMIWAYLSDQRDNGYLEDYAFILPFDISEMSDDEMEAFDIVFRNAIENDEFVAQLARAYWIALSEKDK